MKPKLSVFILLSTFSFLSCNTVSSKAKDAINKTGEVVGKTGSEFVQGVSEGVNNSLVCNISLSSELTDKGLKTGKFLFASEPDANKNKLVMYLIFDKDFNAQLHVKALDEKGLEYGRTTLQVTSKKGQAGYYDFVFDKRVNLENKSKFAFE
ncbi:hypothetical protein ACI6Q2_15170 [Chitinophagaceae bacterium LWZ2-11]